MGELQMWGVVSFLILTSYFWLLSRRNRSALSLEGRYAQALRTIGQNLELQRIDSFELEIQGDDYVVRGEVKGQPRTAKEWPVIKELQPQCYTSKDLVYLDRDGKARRYGSDRISDPHTLSETLRGVGDYVENRGGQLRAVSWRDKVLTITYQTNQNGQRTHKFRLSSSAESG